SSFTIEPMTKATVFVLLLCAASFVFAAQTEAVPALACNLKAISPTQRPRYNTLVKRLRTAVRGYRELPLGYALTLDGKSMSLVETAEWMSMERLCCPFLTMELSSSGHQADWQLTLTGPPGTKDFLQAEFRSDVK